MLYTGIVILTGVITASYAPQLVDRYWVSWLPICLTVAYFNPRLRLIGILFSSFLWATAVMHWQLDHRLSADYNNKRLVVVGEVLNIPRTSLISSRFLFKPLSIPGYSGQLPQKVRLNWRNAPDTLRPGQIWQLNIKLKQPHGFQNPGGFDYERWLFAQGIHATGYVLKSTQNELQGNNPYSLHSLRFRLLQHLQMMCADCQNNGLIQALAIGHRGNISQQTRSLLNKTGTAHLIAVSGLHIGIVAGVFYSLGLWLWSKLLYTSSLKRREFAMILAWVAGFGYSLISGLDLPAQRAMIMLSVVLISLLVKTPFNLIHSINTTLVLVLIISPLVVLSESFWLTFSALMIIAFGAFLLQREQSRLKQLVIIQLLFSILFIPLSIQIFGQIHSASMAANLIAVPLVSFVIVPLNFILLLLFWLPENLLHSLYLLLDKLLDLLIHYLDWLQDHGLQAVSVPEVAGWQLILLLLFVIILLLPRGFISRFILLLIIPPMVFWNVQSADKTLKMTVLDVGMGTSIVIQTSNHSLVYDFGPGNKLGYSLGEWVVLPYLLNQGLQQPDRIVISHADQDHSGGYYALQDRFKGIPVYSGTNAELSKKFPDIEPLVDCHRANSWNWDSVNFEFLSTQPDSSASKNDRSCVLKVTLGESSILITGDIEQKQERQLISSDKLALTAKVLVVPHHGSKTSSSENFIRTVQPESVIFTTGFLNRWKFPRPEIVQRYVKTGSRILQTDKAGAIQLSCTGEDCEIVEYRQQHPRIWY